MSASPKEMDSDTINKIIQQSEFNRDIHKYGNLEAMYNYHNNLFSMPFIPSTRYEFDNLYRSYNEEQYLAWESWMLESKLAKLVENQKNESLIASPFYETICNSVFVSDKRTLYFIKWLVGERQCTIFMDSIDKRFSFTMYDCIIFEISYVIIHSVQHFLELNDKLELKKEGEKSLDPNLVEIIYDSNFNIIAYDENTGSTLAEGINNCIAKKKLEKMRIFLDQLK
ncbi:hypothetical protein HK099_002987 [Clydaea vesicula]|uniref:Uncharacterized protein n=1 Tax=Clydaea vesicula TaxID=447962 RepID=A0AAD5TUL3_9FUNG|nr:hypothetical protein HK099_002987 [Clydaea vesicula]